MNAMPLMLCYDCSRCKYECKTPKMIRLVKKTKRGYPSSLKKGIWHYWEN